MPCTFTGGKLPAPAGVADCLLKARVMKFPSELLPSGFDAAAFFTPAAVLALADWSAATGWQFAAGLLPGMSDLAEFTSVTKLNPLASRRLRHQTRKHQPAVERITTSTSGRNTEPAREGRPSSTGRRFGPGAAGEPAAAAAGLGARPACFSASLMRLIRRCDLRVPRWRCSPGGS